MAKHDVSHLEYGCVYDRENDQKSGGSQRQTLDAYLFAKVKQALLDCSQSVNFINGMI
ncbi:MAG: hypothetical protein IIY06_07235 [Proteobacteria bacterium]|jgi:hypothetical protein|nr:hypothetical protein [Pseudomonadota bacterium]